jgi:hypothetical protein
MTVGSWNPGTSSPDDKTGIDAQFLECCLAIALTADINDIASALTPQQQQMQDIVQLSAEQWQQAVNHYSDQQLIALIRFFTLIEMQLSHWQAGAQSPVIKINRLLKQRGVKLDKALLQWIRENSDNRYIPNGAIV